MMWIDGEHPKVHLLEQLVGQLAGCPWQVLEHLVGHYAGRFDRRLSRY